MSIKDKLIKIQEELCETIPCNRDYEFDCNLENHPIKGQDIYRLYYVDYHRIGEGYGYHHNNVGVIDWPFKPFKLPNGMTREEGFKVLSYLTDFIEKRDDIEPCSFTSVRVLNDVLDLERFGFTRVLEKDDDKIVELFTVSGRLLLFKRSKLYPKYFEWYTEGVTLEEVTDIYAKYNMVFRDIVWLDNQKDKGPHKVLKKD